jgi:hypothetical protein
MSKIKTDIIEPVGSTISISGNASISNGVSVTGNGSFSGKITTASTTGSDSSTTLTTKGYVDSIFNPQGGGLSASYTKLGNIYIQYGLAALVELTLDTTNNHYGRVAFGLTFASAPYSIQVTPRFSAYNAQGDIMGQAASPGTTGFTLVINGASTGTLTNLAGAYWFAVGPA